MGQVNVDMHILQTDENPLKLPTDASDSEMLDWVLQRLNTQEALIADQEDELTI